MSARAAGIPKSTQFSPPVPELIPLSVVLPTMGITLWCIWAVYTTTEALETSVATEMSPEVAADAAEPSGLVVHAAVFPEATPTAAPPEVAADATEPPEAAVLSLIHCMVVAPSNALTACHVTVKGTIADLSAFGETPDGATVEPLELAASAAEPPKVSVVSTCKLSPCPVTAKEAVCELSPCPVTAKEAISNAVAACHVMVKETVTTVEPPEVAVSAAEPSEVSVVTTCKLSSCPVTAMEAVYEPSSCPVMAMEAVYESSSGPVTAKETICEFPSCFITAMEAVYELPGCTVPATEAALEPLPCSEPAEEAISEISLCPELAKVADFEL